MSGEAMFELTDPGPSQMRRETSGKGPWGESPSPQLVEVFCGFVGVCLRALNMWCLGSQWSFSSPCCPVSKFTCSLNFSFFFWLFGPHLAQGLLRTLPSGITPGGDQGFQRSQESSGSRARQALYELGPPDPWISNSNLLPRACRLCCGSWSSGGEKRREQWLKKLRAAQGWEASGKMSCTPHSLPRPEDNPPWGWARGAVERCGVRLHRCVCGVSGMRARTYPRTGEGGANLLVRV